MQAPGIDDALTSATKKLLHLLYKNLEKLAVDPDRGARDATGRASDDASKGKIKEVSSAAFDPEKGYLRQKRVPQRWELEDALKDGFGLSDDEIDRMSDEQLASTLRRAKEQRGAQRSTDTAEVGREIRTAAAKQPALNRAKAQQQQKATAQHADMAKKYLMPAHTELNQYIGKWGHYSTYDRWEGVFYQDHASYMSLEFDKFIKEYLKQLESAAKGRGIK